MLEPSKRHNIVPLLIVALFPRIVHRTSHWANSPLTYARFVSKEETYVKNYATRVANNTHANNSGGRGCQVMLWEPQVHCGGGLRAMFNSNHPWTKHIFGPKIERKRWVWYFQKMGVRSIVGCYDSTLWVQKNNPTPMWILNVTIFCSHKHHVPSNHTTPNVFF